MFTVKVDITQFQAICFLVFQRVKQLEKVPFVDFCTNLRRLAEEHADDHDSKYSFCFPELVGLGQLAYPHEQFLLQNNLLSMEYWKNIIQSFRGKEIIDQEVIDFSNELCDRLGIAY